MATGCLVYILGPAKERWKEGSVYRMYTEEDRKIFHNELLLGLWKTQQKSKSSKLIIWVTSILLKVLDEISAVNRDKNVPEFI